MSGLWNEPIKWTPALKARAIELWVDGKSGQEIADTFGGSVSRSAIIGMVSREGDKIRVATGTNPYRRPDIGRNQRPPKAPRIVKAKPPAKPKQIKREMTEKDVPPGTMLPPLVRLDSRLWVSLPNTTPKDLLSLGKCECRWPLSTGVDELGIAAPSLLFCAAETDNDSSYCKTHRSWSLSKKPLAPLNFSKRAA